MKKSQVTVGKVYIAKVSDRVVNVEIIRTHETKGWVAKNLDTGREVYIRSAARLWEEVNKSA